MYGMIIEWSLNGMCKIMQPSFCCDGQLVFKWWSTRFPQVISELDEKKKEALKLTWESVDSKFGSIFATLLPGTTAKLQPVEGTSFLEGAVVVCQCVAHPYECVCHFCRVHTHIYNDGHSVPASLSRHCVSVETSIVSQVWKCGWRLRVCGSNPSLS